MASAAFIPVASAKTTTGKLTVKINIKPSCELKSRNNSLIDFGSADNLEKDLIMGTTDTSGIEVQCSKSIAYQIGLDAGTSPSALGDYNTRRLKSAASQYISYNLYKDINTKAVWGNDEKTSLQSTGTGGVQKFPVIAKIPKRSTPPADDYSDTVSVIVTY
ncbi:spore coat U domain-containing protein [Ochrobactrum sp. POC9]|uniref:Csu type fimbrial protein n=1 Tax=unclassified Ochrobactrum TaxID=239106 RepID=UPI0015E86C42|nr:spore coat U domain-containing protein [Ochrobactrum sp. POC9]MCH4543330.1 spore coat U domain-containing protein [Ochrobactrum sp. A-1]